MVLGDSPVPEREVSSLPPSFPPLEAAKQGGCNSPEISLRSLDMLPGNVIYYLHRSENDYHY